MAKRILVLFFLVFLSITASAKTLRVGVLLEDRPFSWQQSNKVYLGLAVDLFSHIAKELNWDYTFVPLYPPFNDVINKVSTGKLDILVGPISVTHARYQKVDFSVPFFLNNLGIAVKKPENTNIFITIVKDIGNKIGYILPILLTYFLIIMICFFFIDNKKSFSWKQKHILSKLGNAFWETLVILIHPEIRDSKHVLKRLVLLAWVIPCTIFFSIIVGSIVSTITMVENNKSYLFSLKKEDLAGQKISTLKGNVTIKEGEKLGAIMLQASSREEALKMVSDDKAFGTTDDYITLENAIKAHPEFNLIMSNLNLRNDQLAFVFTKGSPLLNAFNERLLYLQDEGFAVDICSRYVGPKGNLCII
jgi:ABC-type amino acid transport substrate-binding protein